MIPDLSTATPACSQLQVQTFGLSQSDKANYQNAGHAFKTRMMANVASITIAPEFEDSSYGGSYISKRIFDAVLAIDPTISLNTVWVNDTGALTAPGADDVGITTARTFMSQRFVAPGTASHKVQIGIFDGGSADQRGFSGEAPSITPTQACQYYWDSLKYLVPRMREYYVNLDTANSHVYVMMPARFLLDPGPWMGTHRHAQLLLEAINRIAGFKFGVDIYADDMGDSNHLSRRGQINAWTRLADSVTKQTYALSGFYLGPKILSYSKIVDTMTEVVFEEEIGDAIVLPTGGAVPMGFAIAPAVANLMGIINVNNFPGFFPTACQVINSTTIRLTHGSISGAHRLMYPFDRFQNFAGLQKNFNPATLIKSVSGKPLRWYLDGSLTGITW